MEYEINSIFYEDSDFIKRADFCNKNGLIIKEVDADEKGRKFTIIKPTITTSEILTDEYINLKKWYNDTYAYSEQKLRRLHTLGKLTDEGKNPYDELINLYKEAEIKRARIQELERLLSDSSK